MKLVLASFLALLAFSLYVWQKDTVVSEVYLIPDGFRGVVYIFYDRPRGATPIDQDGIRTYQIPSNGILKTSLKLQEGWRPIPAFYYLSGDKRSRLTYVGAGEGGVPGTHACCMSVGNALTKNGSVTYMRFFVGTNDEILELARNAENADLEKIISP